MNKKLSLWAFAFLMALVFAFAPSAIDIALQNTVSGYSYLTDNVYAGGGDHDEDKDNKDNGNCNGKQNCDTEIEVEVECENSSCNETDVQVNGNGIVVVEHGNGSVTVNNNVTNNYNNPPESGNPPGNGNNPPPGKDGEGGFNVGCMTQGDINFDKNATRHNGKYCQGTVQAEMFTVLAVGAPFHITTPLCSGVQITYWDGVDTPGFIELPWPDGADSVTVEIPWLSFVIPETVNKPIESCNSAEVSKKASGVMAEDNKQLTEKKNAAILADINVQNTEEISAETEVYENAISESDQQAGTETSVLTRKGLTAISLMDTVGFTSLKPAIDPVTAGLQAIIMLLSFILMVTLLFYIYREFAPKRY